MTVVRHESVIYFFFREPQRHMHRVTGRFRVQSFFFFFCTENKRTATDWFKCVLLWTPDDLTPAIFADKYCYEETIRPDLSQSVRR